MIGIERATLCIQQRWGVWWEMVEHCTMLSRQRWWIRKRVCLFGLTFGLDKKRFVESFWLHKNDAKYLYSVVCMCIEGQRMRRTEREGEVGQERGGGEIHDICEMENSSFCRRRGVCRLSVVGYWNVGQSECEFFFFRIFRKFIVGSVHLIKTIFLRHNRIHIFWIEISVFILFWFGEKAAAVIPQSKPKRPLTADASSSRNVRNAMRRSHHVLRWPLCGEAMPHQTRNMNRNNDDNVNHFWICIH